MDIKKIPFKVEDYLWKPPFNMKDNKSPCTGVYHNAATKSWIVSIIDSEFKVYKIFKDGKEGSKVAAVE